MFDYLALHGDTILYFFTLAAVGHGWIFPLVKFAIRKLNGNSTNNIECISYDNGSGKRGELDGLDSCKLNSPNCYNCIYNRCRFAKSELVGEEMRKPTGKGKK